MMVRDYSGSNKICATWYCNDYVSPSKKVLLWPCVCIICTEQVSLVSGFPQYSCFSQPLLCSVLCVFPLLISHICNKGCKDYVAGAWTSEHGLSFSVFYGIFFFFLLLRQYKFVISKLYDYYFVCLPDSFTGTSHLSLWQFQEKF